jgi:hypothetical protein
MARRFERPSGRALAHQHEGGPTMSGGHRRKRGGQIEHTLVLGEPPDVQNPGTVVGAAPEGRPRLVGIARAKQRGVDAVADDVDARGVDAQRYRGGAQRAAHRHHARGARQRAGELPAQRRSRRQDVDVRPMQLHHHRQPERPPDRHRRHAVRISPRPEQHVEASAPSQHGGQDRQRVQRGRERVAVAWQVERARVLDLEPFDSIPSGNLGRRRAPGETRHQAGAGKPGDGGQHLDLATSPERTELLPVERRRERLGRVRKQLGDHQNAHAITR